MPGFFSTNLTNQLTVQLSQLGSSILLQAKSYTWEDIANRVVKGSCIGLDGKIGNHYSEGTFGLGTCIYSMAGCFVGYVVSHYLIFGAINVRKDLNNSETRIFSILDSMKNIKASSEPTAKLLKAITHHIEAILTHDLSYQNSSEISQLSQKNTLLQLLGKKLDMDMKCLPLDRNAYIEDILSFWSQPTEQVLLGLNDMLSEEMEPEIKFD